MTEKQLPVLEKVKEYLINNLGFDSYSIYKLKNSSAITINHQKARNNCKASIVLIIKNIHVLHNHFLPFLGRGDLNFITKKYQDYKDFKIICKAVYFGAHKISQIKSLVLKLSLTMNNYRLSTNTDPDKQFIDKLEMDTLVNISPTIEHLSDGRQRDITTRKIVHQHTSCVYEIIHESRGLIKLTLSDAAQVIGVDIKTLSKHLDKGVNTVVDVKGSRVKRVRVFSGIAASK